MSLPNSHNHSKPESHHWINILLITHAGWFSIGSLLTHKYSEHNPRTPSGLDIVFHLDITWSSQSIFSYMFPVHISHHLSVYTHREDRDPPEYTSSPLHPSSRTRLVDCSGNLLWFPSSLA